MNALAESPEITLESFDSQKRFLSLLQVRQSQRKKTYDLLHTLPPEEFESWEGYCRDNGYELSGGALVTNFKLPELCGRDVLDLIDTLQELGYSLKPVIELLNRPPEKKGELVL